MQTKSKDHTPSKATSRCSRTRVCKQNTCTQQIINHQQPRTQPNNQAPPTNPTIQRPKTSSPKPQHPTKQTTYPANPYKANYTPANFSKNKITPKASQTADLNCLNFKLAVPAPKWDHTQNSCPTRSSQPPTLFLHREQDPKPVEIKI